MLMGHVIGKQANKNALTYISGYAGHHTAETVMTSLQQLISSCFYWFGCYKADGWLFECCLSLIMSLS